MNDNSNSNSQVYNLYNFEHNFRIFLTSEALMSPITIKNYLSDFRHFAGWFEKYRSSGQMSSSISHAPTTYAEALIDITPDILVLYKKELSEEKFPFKTINRRLSTLRKFFSFCISQGWIKENPVQQIKNVVPTERILSSFESYLFEKYPADTKKNELISSDVKEFFSLIDA